jgi:hypothetical protein
MPMPATTPGPERLYGQGMSKRYRAAVQVEHDAGRPTAVTWRGRRLVVRSVSGHWRDDPGWWQTQSGPVKIVQRELWRVEASADDERHTLLLELVDAQDVWTLERVYD